MRFWILCIFAVSMQALFGVAPLSAQIEGIYETIGTLPEKYSLETVELEEFLNFTCPHCNNFRLAAKPLKEKYGDRLKVTYIPILFKNQSDWPLRLFFIAEREGRTEEIKNIIFDAAFKYQVNIYDPAVINYLARSSGLGPIFKKEAQAEWVSKLVQWTKESSRMAGVAATPTVVLEKALRVSPKKGMDTFVANLDRIINQLLK